MHFNLLIRIKISMSFNQHLNHSLFLVVWRLIIVICLLVYNIVQINSTTWNLISFNWNFIWNLNYISLFNPLLMSWSKRLLAVNTIMLHIYYTISINQLKIIIIKYNVVFVNSFYWGPRIRFIPQTSILFVNWV